MARRHGQLNLWKGLSLLLLGTAVLLFACLCHFSKHDCIMHATCLLLDSRSKNTHPTALRPRPASNNDEDNDGDDCQLITIPAGTVKLSCVRARHRNVKHWCARIKLQAQEASVRNPKCRRLTKPWNLGEAAQANSS